jgi:hypothetical protein
VKKEPKDIRACRGRGEIRASLAPLDCLELPDEQVRVEHLQKQKT